MLGSKPRDQSQAKAAKAPVIFLHGFPGLAQNWIGLAEAMSPDRACFSVNMPWCTKEKIAIEGIASVAVYIFEVFRKHFSKPAHFVGHDLGAVVLYWLRQSGLRMIMKSASMVSAPHPVAYGTFLKTAEGKLRTRYIDNILSSTDDASLRTVLMSTLQGEDLTISGQLSVALEATNFEALRTIYRQVRFLDVPPLPAASQTQSPVSMVFTENDRLLPASLMAESVALFRSERATLRLSGDSHYPHLTAPAQLAPFLEDFWIAAE